MSGGTREVEAKFWLLAAPTSLLLQSESQPDGVGLGSFDAGGSPVVYRKPVSANRSETFISESQEVRSCTFLAHIRHATEAEPSLENTHPFVEQGRLFAHNGVLGNIPEMRRRLGSDVDLVHGQTDSEHYFALMTKRIAEHGGDVAAGIAAAASEIAADIPLYSLNMILTTPNDLWALRYPDTNELWILERSVGGFDPGEGFDERSESGTLRVQAGELSFLPATVIASERMNVNPGWRLLESGELVHVDSELRVSSTIAVPFPPAHMIDLSTMTAREAVAQGEEPAAEAG